LEELVGVTPTAGWMEMAAKPIEWPKAVGGYNLSYLKPDATAGAYSKDEYAAPLLAFWQRGSGRAAAISFPVSGEFSEPVREWKSYGDFLQTVGRWLMGEALPPGIGLRTKMTGTDLQIDLLFDETWEEKLAQEAPKILIAEGSAGEARPLVWERQEPGHYRTSTPLVPGRWVRGAVQVGQHSLPFGPLVVGNNPEWTFDPQRVQELKALAQKSGGVERVDLTKAWDAPRREEFRDFRSWLLCVLLVTFLTDALLTRLGIEIPLPRLGRKPAAPAAPISIPAAETKAQEAPRPEPLQDIRRGRFQRAKK
jgi:hypothetical protein